MAGSSQQLNLPWLPIEGNLSCVYLWPAYRAVKSWELNSQPVRPGISNRHDTPLTNVHDPFVATRPAPVDGVEICEAEQRNHCLVGRKRSEEVGGVLRRLHTQLLRKLNIKYSRRGRLHGIPLEAGIPAGRSFFPHRRVKIGRKELRALGA
jgi:hypothetical protein